MAEIPWSVTVFPLIAKDPMSNAREAKEITGGRKHPASGSVNSESRRRFSGFLPS
jgi:hypothetical protein